MIDQCFVCCKEYQVSERSKVMVSSRESSRESSSKNEKEQNEELGRRRVAHPSAATCVTRQIVDNQLPKKLVNPQQKMYERWRLMRDVAAEKAVPVGSNVSVSKDAQRRSYVEAAGAACKSILKS